MQNPQLTFDIKTSSNYLDAAYVDQSTGKPRVLVLTDMGNEPDDQMSMVRLLLYANEIDIEGLIATTSTWLKDRTNPQTIHKIIAGYAQVRANLMLHAEGWPEASYLASKVSAGQPGYGLSAVARGQTSAGAMAIIAAADRPDDRPLWISIWGGANTLAQALLHIRETRNEVELQSFVAKLRVYSISDQDDAGPWIRTQFPQLFYVVKPSSADGGEYVYASWTGISGDLFYRNGAGADTSLITNEWLQDNIRSKGSYGKLYPSYLFIMEGDTPAFLNLLGNGLESYRNPAWGGWGGRYLLRQPYGESHAIWTQGGDLFFRVTSQDQVKGIDGKLHLSDQATIWRWREAFQHDFATRMDWTLQNFDAANHPPQIQLNGQQSSKPMMIEAKVGDVITLDASDSIDPDGQPLSFTWFHYPEAGYVQGQGLAELAIHNANQPQATLTVTQACRDAWIAQWVSCQGGVAHVILAVTDSGTPALTRYRRVIIHVTAKDRQ
ncbi:DUF1593 domain-containing protein [Aestuariicella hydrocarbonica]|uniref:DUF1593 domain-containing protein n=2 Tax=Pseudomaricurvus hydrocarbonicus TaxID=1470433 RepID=A0A9E5MNA3_9GAMM|nr:DUF1593 domain-containing protein [Aestuariicella hydrocarbonica]